MLIHGYFHFLHARNVAWLLEARSAAQKIHQPLEILIKTADDDTEQSLIARKNYLTPFGLADQISITVTGSTHDIPTNPIQEHPDPPSETNMNRVLDPWIQKHSNVTVFSGDNAGLNAVKEYQDKTIITTNGCFDILHPGHLETLRFAAALGDVLIVLINSDQSVKRFKGPTRPVHSHGFRATLLCKLPWVDKVVIFQGDTPLDQLECIRPDGHVKGGSFIPERIKAEKDLLARWGGKLHSIPMVGNFSSTRLLETYSTKPFPL